MTESLTRPAIHHEPISILLLNAFFAEDLHHQIVTAWCDKLDRLGHEYEMLIVVPGENVDGTSLPGQWQTRYPKLRPIPVPARKGVGDDLREGIAAARHPLFFYTDCTHPFAP